MTEVMTGPFKDLCMLMAADVQVLCIRLHALQVTNLA